MRLKRLPGETWTMRTRFVLPFLLALILTGCAQNYVIRLRNGQQITTPSKPKLKGSAYYWKDAKGGQNSIPQSRVMEVLPASMAEEEKARFKPSAR